VKKSAISILALVSIALGAAAPAFADNDYATMAKDTAMFPVRALALGSGVLFGTPIAILRCAATRTTGFTRSGAEAIGGKSSLPCLVLASPLTVPFGLLAGTAEGCYYGPKHAIENCLEHPFSKDSFSLGEME